LHEDLHSEPTKIILFLYQIYQNSGKGFAFHHFPACNGTLIINMAALFDHLLVLTWKKTLNESHNIEAFKTIFIFISKNRWCT